MWHTMRRWNNHPQEAMVALGLIGIIVLALFVITLIMLRDMERHTDWEIAVDYTVPLHDAAQPNIESWLDSVDEQPFSSASGVLIEEPNLISFTDQKTAAEVEEAFSLDLVRPANVRELMTFARTKGNEAAHLAAFGTTVVQNGESFVPCYSDTFSGPVTLCAKDQTWGAGWQFLAFRAPTTREQRQQRRGGQP